MMCTQFFAQSMQLDISSSAESTTVKINMLVLLLWAINDMLL